MGRWTQPFSKADKCRILSHLGFPGSSDGNEFACKLGDPGSIPGLGRPLEKGMATHASILA